MGWEEQGGSEDSPEKSAMLEPCISPDPGLGGAREEEGARMVERTAASCPGVTKRDTAAWGSPVF